MARTLIIALLLLFTAACGRPDFGSPTDSPVVGGETGRVPAPDPSTGGTSPPAPGEICDPEPHPDPSDLDAEDARHYDAFAFNVYRAVDATLPNVVVAPHTVVRSLVVAHAAESSAADAIDAAVDTYRGDIYDDLYNAFNLADQLLDNVGYDSTSFATLGAIWLDESVAVESVFSERLIAYTGLPVGTLDFGASPEDARNEINNWYSANSAGTISDVVGARTLDPSTAFVITDAAWLSAPWKFGGFDAAQTVNAPFQGVSSEVDVPMMHATLNVKHFGDDQLHAVTLPLDGDFSLIALLPRNFDDLSASLDQAMLRRIMRESYPSDLQLSFPRFELSSRVTLSSIADNLGLGGLFGEDAVYDAFADDTQLHDAYHRTWISFDEDGVQANTGAVPADPEFDAAVPTVVRFDRPFFFAVHSAKLNQFVFLGRVTQL